MKRNKRLFSVLLAICLMVLMAVPVWADSTESVNSVRNGVLQVNLNWIDPSGKAHPIQGGSGFLINDQTLLTNHHVVEMNNETKAAASAAYGVDFVNDTKLEVRVQVVIQRDVVMDATVRASSAEMDVAVVELSEPIGGRVAVALGDSSSVTETQTVYALGFPQLPELAQDVKYYTNSDVTVTDGIIAKKILNNGTPFIQHSAKISSGNSGGPLVNAEGQVVGINTFGFSVEEGYYYAMEINDIKSLLDDLRISYNEGTASATPEPTRDTTPDAAPEPTPEPTPEPAALDKAELESAISAAEAKMDGGKYTEDSVKALNAKLDNAYEVKNDANTSQDLVDKAAADVKAAADALEEAGGMGMMLWVIVGAVVVVVIIVVVVLISSSSKKAKKAEQDRERIMRQREAEQRRPQPTPPQPTPQPQRQSYAPVEGAGETSVLGEGRGETTVLGAGAQSAAYMIRKKNNERVTIGGPSFTVGKERSRVNYCISDNTSISRCHARITRKGAQYFVADMNSTNFTFVNGIKVMPGQEVQLNDRDVVRFADEDFEFHAN